MDKVKAQQVLTRIEEILRWEQRSEQQKDQKFAELGKHLCEVRKQGYWRLGHKSFEDYLEKKFPDSKRKAYFLMSIHDHLCQIPSPKIEELGWSKALELAKVARSQGRHFDSATWLHKAQGIDEAGVAGRGAQVLHGGRLRALRDGLLQAIRESVAGGGKGAVRGGANGGDGEIAGVLSGTDLCGLLWRGGERSLRPRRS